MMMSMRNTSTTTATRARARALLLVITGLGLVWSGLDHVRVRLRNGVAIKGVWETRRLGAEAVKSVSKLYRSPSSSSMALPSILRSSGPASTLSSKSRAFEEGVAAATPTLAQTGRTDPVKLNRMEIGCGTVMQSAEPIIIIHGLMGNSMNFNTWAKDLFGKLESTRRIIIPDLRNHGQSPHTSSMSYLEMMEDIILLMDEEGIEQAEFIGHSLGGKVASALALCHPERVKSLAVLDIAPVTYSEEDASWWQVDKVVNAMASLDLNAISSRDEADKLLRKAIPDPILRRFALTNLVGPEPAWHWRINVETIRRSLPVIRNFDIGQGDHVDVSHSGKRYEGDVFFVSGRRSKYISTRHLPSIATLFPKYRMVTLKNAGHWVHSEEPEETVRFCKMFLDRDYLK